MQSTSWEAQAGNKIAGKNINNLRYADDTTLMAESEEELKKLLMNVKEESEKVGLKVNIHWTKIMASGPIISWQIDGETVETVADFIFWSSKITADGDCTREIKRCLLFGRKAMTNLDSTLKSRDNSIETSILSSVKQITSPGWMHETSAQGWCTGKTQRDGMGREGGSRWGTHVNPWLIHVNVWQKPL